MEQHRQAVAGLAGLVCLRGQELEGNLERVRRVRDESLGKPGRPADAQETRVREEGQKGKTGKQKGSVVTHLAEISVSD